MAADRLGSPLGGEREGGDEVARIPGDFAVAFDLGHGLDEAGQRRKTVVSGMATLTHYQAMSWLTVVVRVSMRPWSLSSVAALMRPVVAALSK